MIARLSVIRSGVVLGVVLGGWHLCWSILVVLSWAQPVVDFVFWMHFIKPVYVIEPFELGRALVLLAVTSALGFVIGAALAWVWNAVHRSPAARV